MKVALINVTNYGSTGKIMLQIAQKCREEGIEAYTFSRKWKDNPDFIEGHRFFGYFYDNLFHRAVGPVLGMGERLSVLGTKKLVKELEAISPDIIHLHNIHDHWLNYKILFEYLNTTNIPIIWTQHDCWAFTGGCMHFSSLNCSKWKSECNNCPRSNKITDNSIQQFNLRKQVFTANKNLILIPVSKWLESEIRQSFFS